MDVEVRAEAPGFQPFTESVNQQYSYRYTLQEDLHQICQNLPLGSSHWVNRLPPV